MGNPQDAASRSALAMPRESTLARTGRDEGGMKTQIVKAKLPHICRWTSMNSGFSTSRTRKVQELTYVMPHRVHEQKSARLSMDAGGRDASKARSDGTMIGTDRPRECLSDS
jgi:hypothetical protein